MHVIRYLAHALNYTKIEEVYDLFVKNVARLPIVYNYTEADMF